MVLVETSFWTQTLRRKGDPAIRAKVNALLAANQVVWCDIIRLELWNGATNDLDRELLTKLEEKIPLLPITAAVWQQACSIAHKARTSGLNVPATDVLIFACARVYGVTIEHADKHFILLDQLK
jgi:predicted nucleic acid-binding protein